MMKRLTVMLCIIALGFVLAGCGAKKNELDKGHELVNKGDCTGAMPYLEDTIAMPDDTLDMAYAYFLIGKCAEKSGNLAVAYKNYYAAKVIACYVVKNETHSNLNTLGRSEYCQRIIPEMLEKIAPTIGANEVDRITKEVDGILHEKYLDQFHNQTS